MKRMLLIFILIFSLLICLPACESNNTTDNTDNTGGLKENPKFAKLNELYSQDFTDYTITISTTSPYGDIVNKTYVVGIDNGIRRVDYTIEELNGFIIDQNGITAPDGYKSVSVGTLEPEDAKSAIYDFPKFNFSYEGLSTDVVIRNIFSAQITSFASFMSLNLDVENAKVELEYNETETTHITVSYTTESGNTVSITYTPTK